MVVAVLLVAGWLCSVAAEQVGGDIDYFLTETADETCLMHPVKTEILV